MNFRNKHLGFSLLFLCALPNLCFISAQPSHYSQPFEFRDTILFDEFTDFKNEWLLGIEEGSWTETFEDGKLYFQSHSEHPKEDVIPVIVNTDRDFEIEVSIQFSRGNINQAYGLQFGKSKKRSKQYDFFVTANGQYTIDKYDDGFVDYVSFTQSGLVNNYAPNKLTYRKLSDSAYYFLNERLVYKMPFQPFFGNLMGIQVGAHSTILVDYFKVFYLDQAKELLSKVLIIDYSHDADRYSRLKGIPITLQVQITNAGTLAADSLNIEYQLTPNIEVFERNKVQHLKAGETKEVTLELFPTRNFNSDKINIEFDIQGADINNADDVNLTIYLENPAKASHDKSLVQTYSEFRGDDPLKGLNVARAQRSLEIGKYYALIIGIDDFQGEWNPLRNAVNDAKALKEILENKYQFDLIRTLYNSQATRENILSELEWFMDHVTENDNLLIYYSGHGYYNDLMEQGYWVPFDAKSKQIHLFISNQEIRSFMAGIRSKHTLLVTDACFSGDIFRGKTLSIPYVNSTKYYHKVYSLISRKALTSGGVEPVQDGGREGHSVFGYYLLKTLENNDNKFLDASEIYNSIKIPVINNSQQTPLYSPVNNTGDEGGQFIFISK